MKLPIPNLPPSHLICIEATPRAAARSGTATKGDALPAYSGHVASIAFALRFCGVGKNGGGVQECKSVPGARVYLAMHHVTQREIHIFTSSLKDAANNVGAGVGAAGSRPAAFGFLTCRMLKELADPAAPAALRYSSIADGARATEGNILRVCVCVCECACACVRVCVYLFSLRRNFVFLPFFN